MRLNILLLFILVIFCNSCSEKTDYYNLPSLSSDKNVNAVIEIPAGTNKKIEYNKKIRTFEIDKKNNKDRVIEFLPYLGNYGFIPSTYSDPKKGGDGDALDVLVLSENVEIGTVMEITPIGMLKLIDKGEIDYKIIAVPSDKEKKIIDIESFNGLTKDFPEVKNMIEIWFLNYNKEDEAIINGWENEKVAFEEIYKNKLQ
ncbi:inorganic diphosphatase [Winogradskyella pulchriflava]|uniref:inorganic diphosphatase n=1 Tax=Winogradskyella pulchriflava TaxID=1110688 RepID=A0ABV6Q564_9FLAO